MQTAAFFDIDGTLYREGFIADLFKMLIKCEVIEYNEWQDKVRPAFENWDRRLGNYDKYLMQMAAGYTEALKGHHKSLMDHIVTRIIKDKAMRTYVYTRNRIQWHKEKGHLVFTISGSPEELVKAMAEFYQLDGYVGSKYLMDENQYYTGEIIPMWNSKAKEGAILNLQDRYDLDLSKSWSYGDTAGDLSMFKHTGHPVLINPTRELLTLVREDEALARRSEIIVERKDVIYKLAFDNLVIIK